MIKYPGIHFHCNNWEAIAQSYTSEYFWIYFYMFIVPKYLKKIPAVDYIAIRCKQQVHRESLPWQSLYVVHIL